MIYYLNIIKLLFSIEDHLYRISRAEETKNLWKISGLLIYFSIGIHVWMAYLGIGSSLILNETLLFSIPAYESSKFWFMIGRGVYGVFYAFIIIFVPVFIFNLLTNIPYQKLVAMQLVVFFITLLERTIWIPVVIMVGLEWYVSPFSFGIIASYITEKSWIIYFLGAISIFKLWIIWFQIKYISRLAQARNRVIWISVLTLHIAGWWLTVLIASFGPLVIGRWFG